MRCVKKRIEPPLFMAWKNQENEEWRPTYSKLQNPEKDHLLQSLLAEQGYTCCYCGRSIGANEAHIEHFRPQEPNRYPELQLDYTNLFASCIRETKKETPRHCGHLKDNWFEESLAISPLDERCESRFRYTLTGTISPKREADTSAEKMIGVLGLDCEFLRNRREAALAGIFDADFLASATIDEIERLIADYSKPVQGELDSFFHVILCFAVWQRAWLSA